MDVKEQLKYFSEHGVSITYIAHCAGVAPATLTKWLRDEKGITHKNENIVQNSLKTLALQLLDVTKN